MNFYKHISFYLFDLAVGQVFQILHNGTVEITWSIILAESASHIDYAHDIMSLSHCVLFGSVMEVALYNALCTREKCLGSVSP